MNVSFTFIQGGPLVTIRQLPLFSPCLVCFRDGSRLKVSPPYCCPPISPAQLKNAANEPTPTVASDVTVSLKLMRQQSSQKRAVAVTSTNAIKSFNLSGTPPLLRRLS